MMQLLPVSSCCYGIFAHQTPASWVVSLSYSLPDPLLKPLINKLSRQTFNSVWVNSCPFFSIPEPWQKHRGTQPRTGLVPQLEKRPVHVRRTLSLHCQQLHRSGQPAGLPGSPLWVSQLWLQLMLITFSLCFLTFSYIILLINVCFLYFWHILLELASEQTLQS